MPPALHRTLVHAAADEGVSLNAYCVRRLAEPADSDATSIVRTAVLGHLQGLLGDRLLGVAVLGSWARGEAAAGSDIDVVVVLDAAVPLTRDLYRRWDAAPLTVEGRAVDAHFVHLPPLAAPPAALWCEVAVDGRVWYDRWGGLTRHLVAVRRAIADGRVVRGRAHGQTYWVGAA
jgi:predicted nucleotidyltransferase